MAKCFAFCVRLFTTQRAGVEAIDESRTCSIVDYFEALLAQRGEAERIDEVHDLAQR